MVADHVHLQIFHSRLFGSLGIQCHCHIHYLAGALFFFWEGVSLTFLVCVFLYMPRYFCGGPIRIHHASLFLVCRAFLRVTLNVSFRGHCHQLRCFWWSSVSFLELGQCVCAVKQRTHIAIDVEFAKQLLYPLRDWWLSVTFPSIV